MKMKKILKYLSAFFCLLTVCITVSGCSRSIGDSGTLTDIIPDSGVAVVTRDHLPIKRDDGRKFKMSVVSVEPFNDTFCKMYYVIESLKANGWISYDRLPYDPDADNDTLDMLNWLADNAKSEYMEFDRSLHYYTSVSTEEEIYKSLKGHIEVKKDVDLVLALGTAPAAMIERFDLDIPLLMYNVTDPIGSGLIESADNSGDSRYWAHVDPSPYYRQMQYYFDVLGFSNLGAVYSDEIVSGIPEYRMAAEENGFSITEYNIDRDSMEENAFYEFLAQTYQKLITEDKIDAYVLTTHLIPSTAKAKEMLRVFFDANIPVIVQEGSAYVTDGAALMIVEPREAAGTAPFVSETIGSVFNGAKPGDLEQEYVTSPYLILNLDVADAVDFPPKFEMLVACEKIICSD